MAKNQRKKVKCSGTISVYNFFLSFFSNLFEGDYGFVYFKIDFYGRKCLLSIFVYNVNDDNITNVFKVKNIGTYESVKINIIIVLKTTNAEIILL
jgi:hypothetical protein